MFVAFLKGVSNLTLFEKLLTANGMDRFSFLHLAAGLGSLPVLKILLQHLSPETVVHPRGVTPLHCATMRSVPASVVRLLVDHGSDPHTADDHNKSDFLCGRSHFLK